MDSKMQKELKDKIGQINEEVIEILQQCYNFVEKNLDESVNVDEKTFNKIIQDLGNISCTSQFVLLDLEAVVVQEKL